MINKKKNENFSLDDSKLEENGMLRNKKKGFFVEKVLR